MQKRVLIAEDLSCVGRCSLSAALPVLSALGHQAIPLPTCLLSSHTGGFPNVFRRDLTDEMQRTLQSWDAIPLRFDAIYIGYLQGAHQAKPLDALLARYHRDGCVLAVDPVMGDGGKRYASLEEELRSVFLRLIAKADLCFPNLTEASLLTGLPYIEAPDDGEIIDRLKALKAIGCGHPVITGIRRAGDQGVAFGPAQGGVFSDWRIEVPGHFPGTGDLFMSAALGLLLCGAQLQRALSGALDFMAACLRDAAALPESDRRFGIPFEKHLGRLTAMAVRWEEKVSQT